MDEIAQERFQILALDGGGIKGFYSAALLARLEDDLGIDNIIDCFDMVVGTSTGGIIALGLGFGLRPREIVQFYSQHGPSIFPDSWIARQRHYFSRKYSPGPLREALKKCFYDRRLADSHKRLVIPSYNLDKGEVYLFKTPHHERLRRDWKEPMWKVALATSAAPTYFPSCQEVDHIRLIDGGLWANNPTMVGVVEALAMLNKPLSAISVLSIGTTDPIEEKPSGLTNGGMLAWRSAAVDACFRGQSHGVQGQAKLLLGDRAVRLDPVVPAGVFALDRVAEARMLSEAAHVSRDFAPKFESQFLCHRAAQFTPIYS
ncbi:MAG: patatin-like phospholipase family protein [Pirellula sp.]|nr:patatin-like phospholipase family protein [Pirellula sp.]